MSSSLRREGSATLASGVAAAALVASALLLLPAAAHAATYQVGPGRTYRQLGDLPALAPGDLVEVDGGATYDAVLFDAPGAPGRPVVIRGLRAGDGARPVLSGGRNTVELAGDHYVLEGFEITGGTARCVYHHADDIVVRDVVIHDCPAQGLLGADNDSGSLLLEHCEVYRCGAGDRSHQIYMSTDQLAHPGAVFRMQHCYLHDGNGGNGVKSRAERNEIYYNWIEGSFYHELELIGPDPGGTPVAEDAHEEHSDVVGNVFVKTGLNPDHWVVRFGGDGTGQSWGRYRFAYNTVILAPGTAGVFRLFDGISSLQADDNVIFQTGAGDPQIVRDSEASWRDGVRRVAGSHNWLVSGTGARNVPVEWTGTIMGADPAFESLAGHDLRPREGSPLVDAADPAPAGIAGFEVPMPEVAPRFHPPPAVLMAPGSAVARPVVGPPDIGAYELGSGPPVVPDAGVPDAGVPDAGAPDAGAPDAGGTDAGPPPPVDAGPPCTPACAGRTCGDDGCGGSCGLCDVPRVCGAGGSCACEAPRAECAGECVDPSSDPRHCGACGAACATDEVCGAGACSTSCAAGRVACERACIDPASDVLHCGGCGMACGAGERCEVGACRAPAPPPPPPDAGARLDASAGDSGTGAGSDDGGCGCAVAGRSSGAPRAAASLALLALVLLARARASQRRRRRVGRAGPVSGS